MLVAAGVFVGSREKRSAIVDGMAGTVSVEELQRACEFVLSAYKPEQRVTATAALAAILRDPGKRGEVLEDIRRHHAMRGSLAVSYRDDHNHGDVLRQRGVEAVRQFDAAYDAWLADVQAGRLVPQWTPPSFMRRGASA